MRHRARRRRPRVLGMVLVVVLTALVLGVWWTLEQRPAAAPRLAGASDLRPVLQPTARASPKYLTRGYRAPPGLIQAGAGGTLRIPSLRLRAPVDAVEMDGSAMAVPNDPTRVGWLTSTARAGDLIGSSVLAGHVSDRSDRPGVLARLTTLEPGARIVWSDRSGRVHRFRVTSLRRFPRSTGLPASVFASEGPHELHLVTCADRVSTAAGGFHYRSNLVVTALAVTRQTARGSTG